MILKSMKPSFPNHEPDLRDTEKTLAKPVLETPSKPMEPHSQSMKDKTASNLS